MAKPKKQRRRWFTDMEPADYILSAIGLCLGTAAALFPWHVYLHPDSYGPPRMTFSRGGVIPGGGDCRAVTARAGSRDGYV